MPRLTRLSYMPLHQTLGAKLPHLSPTSSLPRFPGQDLIPSLPSPLAVSIIPGGRNSVTDGLTVANDVNKSFRNTTGNGTDLYNTDLNSYFATVDRLYQAGARRFVFNGVLPFDRSQVGIGAGATLQAKLRICAKTIRRLSDRPYSSFHP